MIRVLVPVVLQLIFVTIIYAQPATEKERIDALNQRAETFRGSRPDSMIALANRALEASKSSGYMKGEADALRWLALGRMLTSESGVNELLNRSIDLFTTLDDQIGLASTLNIQATHLLQQGAFDLAGERWQSTKRCPTACSRSIGKMRSQIWSLWQNSTERTMKSELWNR
jgi:hypothetical protein